MWQDEPYTTEELTTKDNYINNRWFKKKEYGKALQWNNAIEYANNLRLGDYTDWRIPTIQELIILLSTKEYLTYSIESTVWSYTYSEELENIAQRGVNFDPSVDFDDAIDEVLLHSETHFVRCVRNI